MIRDFGVLTVGITYRALSLPEINLLSFVTYAEKLFTFDNYFYKMIE